MKDKVSINEKKELIDKLGVMCKCIQQGDNLYQFNYVLNIKNKNKK